jgi:hypothetical protein
VLKKGVFYFGMRRWMRTEEIAVLVLGAGDWSFRERQEKRFDGVQPAGARLAMRTRL